MPDNPQADVGTLEVPGADATGTAARPVSDAVIATHSR
jgi:hypothetical protein